MSHGFAVHWAASLPHTLRSGLLALCTAALVLADGGVTNAQQDDGLAAAVALEDALTDAIERCEHSVVAIARVRHGEGAVPFAEAVGQPLPTDPDFVPSEYATGVVIDRRGLIVTNYHVLGEIGACDYYVTTIDGQVHRAQIRGADPWSDLAVLAIDADNLTPMPLGDGEEVRKGQIALVLGNPYAIARDGECSAGWGMIANISRKPPGAESEGRLSSRATLHHYGTLIQVDARLNLGTSGGALINLEGEMIGLTTSLAALAGAERSAGYAIPVDDTFRRAVEKLRNGQEVEFGYLGVAPEELDPIQRTEGNRGVSLGLVVPGSPAAAAGLRSDDILLELGGRPIHDPDELIVAIAQHNVESRIAVKVLRDNRELEQQVVLSKKHVESNWPAIVTEREPNWRGARIDYASAMPHFHELIDAADPAGCVAVIEVEHDSPAWQAGLRPGVFISHVNGERVATPAAFRAAAQQPGDVLLKLPAAVGPAQELRVQAS